MANTAKVETIDRLTVSASVLADLLGVTERRVRQLAEEGIFMRESKGRYNLPESIKTYINMLKMESDIVNSGQTNGLDLDVEKAIHERVKRNQAEIKLALMKGDVHKSEDVKRVMIDMLTSFRTRLLNIPAKVAPIVAVKKDAGVIRELLTLEVVEVLEELKGYNPAEFYGREYIEYDEDEIEVYERHEDENQT